MAVLPEPVQNLALAFERLPGIGPKTAARLTFYLLRAPDESRDNWPRLCLPQEPDSLCENCFNITRAGQSLCEICANPERDESLICVVEEPLDALAIERTAAFKGRYHVLHGVLSPIEASAPRT